MRKFILISILLNVGLVGAVAYFATQRKQTTATVETKKETTEGKTPAATKKATQKNETVAVNVAGEKFSWRDVESEDYKNYIANLRVIQCPEETIRDIIIADVNKFYANKLKPLRKPVEEFKFWKNENNWGGRQESEAFMVAQRQAEKEKRALLKELLGSDYEKEMAKQNGWSNRAADEFNEKLPQETKDKLSEIQQKFNDQRNEIYRKAKGYHDEEVQADLRKIEKAQRDEMAKILSPDDALEWQLRNSSVAQNMKWNELEGFEASEEEFRAVFKAKIAAEDARATSSGDESDKAKRDADRKVQKDAEEELKKTLGDDRFKEYQLAQNWEYKELARIAERQGVSKESVMKVYEMKADVEKAGRQINADKTLTPEQRREKLLAIKQATEQEVTGSLGERGFKAWKRNAWWLRNIVPNEAPQVWTAPK